MFRQVPQEAFGIKPIVRIKDVMAVVNNYRLYEKRARATNSICAVVLKGDVHGIGIDNVALPLYEAGARYFFIEELVEGIELRKLLPTQDARIYTMAGMLSGEEPHFYSHNISPCLSDIEQIKRWNLFCKSKPNMAAAIHLDTHMNRIGLLDEDVNYLSDNFRTLTENFSVDIFMSHLYDIKGNDVANCYEQLRVFMTFLAKLPKAMASISCTDGIITLNNGEFNLDMIRPGIGLVGGAPNATSTLSTDIRHTLEIYAKISQRKRIRKGSTVGYGGKFTLKRDSTIVLAHIGYKDGYLSAISETDNSPKGAYMHIEKYRLPVIGRISLGLTMLDATDVPEALLESYSYVEVVGPNVDIRVLADIVGCYEIMMALGRPNIKAADYTAEEFDALFGVGKL